MKTARERADMVFIELKNNGDLNLNDGWDNEHPQIVDRIKNVIELQILRQMEDYRQLLLKEFREQTGQR